MTDDIYLLSVETLQKLINIIFLDRRPRAFLKIEKSELTT